MSPNFSTVPFPRARQPQKSVVHPLTPKKFYRLDKHKKAKIFRTQFQPIRNRFRRNVHDVALGHPQNSDIEPQFYPEKQEVVGRLAIHLRKLRSQAEVDLVPFWAQGVLSQGKGWDLEIFLEYQRKRLGD